MRVREEKRGPVSPKTGFISNSQKQWAESVL